MEGIEQETKDKLMMQETAFRIKGTVLYIKRFSGDTTLIL